MNSTLMTNERMNILKNWIPKPNNNNNITFKLLYRGSRDGFSAGSFHEKCDNKGPTVTIVLANNCVFGGYTDISKFEIIIIINRLDK